MPASCDISRHEISPVNVTFVASRRNCPGGRYRLTIYPDFGWCTAVDRRQWLPISEAPDAWPGRPGKEASINARKNAAAPDRRKTEESREKAASAPPMSRPAGVVTTFPQAHPGELSNRALNVLKMLAVELMASNPGPEDAFKRQFYRALDDVPPRR